MGLATASPAVSTVMMVSTAVILSSMSRTRRNSSGRKLGLVGRTTNSLRGLMMRNSHSPGSGRPAMNASASPGEEEPPDVVVGVVGGVV